MKSSNAVDSQVGDRLRSQRMALGMSIESLANKIGSTVQQVLQWEQGAERVGAAYLRKLSAVLDVEFDYFFPQAAPRLLNGEAGPNEATRPRSLLGSATSVEDLRLIHAFANIRNAAFREVVIRLAEAMAEAECEADARVGDA
jgi:transcriptional regulator with XRE-family HTH domain